MQIGKQSGKEMESRMPHLRSVSPGIKRCSSGTSCSMPSRRVGLAELGIFLLSCCGQDDVG